MLPISRFSL